MYQNSAILRPHRPGPIVYDTETDRKRPGRVPSALLSTVNDYSYACTFSAKTGLLGEQARASRVETVELIATVLGSYHIPNRHMLWISPGTGGAVVTLGTHDRILFSILRTARERG